MGERERPGMTKYQLCLLVVVACLSLIGCNEDEDFKSVIGQVFGVNEIPTSELLVPKDDVYTGKNNWGAARLSRKELPRF